MEALEMDTDSFCLHALETLEKKLVRPDEALGPLSMWLTTSFWPFDRPVVMDAALKVLGDDVPEAVDLRCA